ncbi:unnamed protein product [Acanthosepion pharaonis]|uniref:Uncharacterized protein n=1 Tax=Acanthosepion pharaonis TaxID=158019 RepID=A0A812AZJ7_ACAPH|nr:unnamed protein product [Sepia pharaonis]
MWSQRNQPPRKSMWLHRGTNLTEVLCGPRGTNHTKEPEELTSLKFYVVPEETSLPECQCVYRGTNLTEVLCGPRGTNPHESQCGYRGTNLTEVLCGPRGTNRMSRGKVNVSQRNQPTRRNLTSLKFYVVPDEPTSPDQCGYRGTNLTEVLCGPRGTNLRTSVWLQMKFYVVPEEPTYTKVNVVTEEPVLKFCGPRGTNLHESQCGYRGTNLTEVLCGPRGTNLPKVNVVTEEPTSLKFYVVPEEPTSHENVVPLQRN